MTGMGLTNAEPILTSPTCESRLADTEVVVGQLDAVEAVAGVAGIGEAFVDVALAAFSGEPRGAVAAIATHSVHTGAVVQTLGRGVSQPQGWSAVVFIDLTEDT